MIHSRVRSRFSPETAEKLAHAEANNPPSMKGADTLTYDECDDNETEPGDDERIALLDAKPNDGFIVWCRVSNAWVLSRV